MGTSAELPQVRVLPVGQSPDRGRGVEYNFRSNWGGRRPLNSPVSGMSGRYFAVALDMTIPTRLESSRGYHRESADTSNLNGVS